MARLVEFYYDIACPFSYVATYSLRSLLSRSDVKVIWKPVHFGSIDPGTVIGSPIVDRPSSSKSNWIYQDLQMMISRLQVPIRRQAKHLDQGGSVQRLLASIDDNSNRQKLSLALFRHYWQNGGDIQSIQNLKEVALDVGLSMDVNKQIEIGADNLNNFNTESTNKGVYRLPGFFVDGKLYHGMDRLHFVEKILGNPSARELRLALPNNVAADHKAKLTFYFDFASPWSHIANTYMSSFLKELHPVNVEVEYVPVILGAIMQALGTSIIPVQKIQRSKVRASRADMHEYLHHFGNITLKMNSHFPIQTLMSLRVAIANDSADLRRRIFEAAWINNQNISKTEVLAGIIEEAGLNSTTLLKQAQEASVKSQLKNNVMRAIKAGVFGVPSFQVNSGPTIFGADRMNIVADMICGWEYVPGNNSKL
ncbi:2-hydroxychromene-2-carboxylate isomerase [Trichoplax sp. H2]|nr:2-hydroxychromene-2-carboxylate isomerase [Trichoplax sp. H2]|eukprot:RDD39665.1 2-hydroxychromene-2-carboxylate isomerase [Trichoplax sp. H2]